VHLFLLRRLLGGVDLLLTHGLQDGENELLAVIPHRLNLPGEGLGVVRAAGELEVLADFTLIVQEAEL